MTIRFPEIKRLLWEKKHAIDEDLSRLPTPIEKGTARLRISNLCDDFIKEACDHINAHDTGREFYLKIRGQLANLKTLIEGTKPLLARNEADRNAGTITRISVLTSKTCRSHW